MVVLIKKTSGFRVWYSTLGLSLFPMFLCLIVLVTAQVSLADIFRYVDHQGVTHFTNKPKHNQFKVYMKDLRQDHRLRTRFSAAVGRQEDFEPIILAASSRYGVDAGLIRAVIHAESGYNVHAVSSAGAGGLMQLMPDTARDLKVVDRFNASQNVDGGVRYLKFLLDTFRGDVHLALAAYNAGLSRVVKYGGIPPYRETRQYVAKVIDLWQRYP